MSFTLRRNNNRDGERVSLLWRGLYSVIVVVHSVGLVFLSIEQGLLQSGSCVCRDLVLLVILYVKEWQSEFQHPFQVRMAYTAGYPQLPG